MTQKKTVTPERAVVESLAAEVVVERFAQIERWGEQNHPSLFGESDRRKFAQASEYWHQINDARVELDCLAWDGILLEEVYEALSEIDPLLRRMELIQVAAVALAEAEAIDRRIEAGEYAEIETTGACPLNKPECDPNANGCDGECEGEEVAA